MGTLALPSGLRGLTGLFGSFLGGLRGHAGFGGLSGVLGAGGGFLGCFDAPEGDGCAVFGRHNARKHSMKLGA